MSCLFAVLTFDIVARFTSKQTVITLDKLGVHIAEIYFPAVTICPEISAFDKDGNYK